MFGDSGLFWCRHVGLLVVHVSQARDLKKMDTIGKSDPFVELYTQPNAVAKTVSLHILRHQFTWGHHRCPLLNTAQLAGPPIALEEQLQRLLQFRRFVRFLAAMFLAYRQRPQQWQQAIL